MFAKKLPLNSVFKEVVAKLTGNRKPDYSTPLVTYQNKKTFRRKALHLDQKLVQDFKDN